MNMSVVLQRIQPCHHRLAQRPEGHFPDARLSVTLYHHTMEKNSSTRLNEVLRKAVIQKLLVVIEPLLYQNSERKSEK